MHPQRSGQLYSTMREGGNVDINNISKKEEKKTIKSQFFFFFLLSSSSYYLKQV